ncbi:MAG: hypothetical protein M3362_00760 [Acidobacteriota bacterium]|nr:hypothetical protein [Acidobacteriota bacterium]
MGKGRFYTLLISLTLISCLLLLSGTVESQDVFRRRERIPVREFEVRFPKIPGIISQTAEGQPAASGLIPDSFRPPLLFQSNLGQADRRFSFVVRSVNFAAGFTSSSITAAVLRPPANAERGQRAVTTGNALQLTFRGASPVTVRGQNSVPGTINVVSGRDKARWRSNVPSFGVLHYCGLYRGMQMFVRASTGRLEYALLVDPGTNLSGIRIRVGGSERLRLDDSGNLIMETSGGPVVQTRPRFIEKRGEERRELTGRFVLRGDDEYGFEVDDHAQDAQLLIDPEIVFATYFGGSGNEGLLGADDGANDYIGRGFDVAFGPNGHIYVTGMTASPDFPATAQGSLRGSSDAFVMRIDPQQPQGQQLVYATYVGGSESERGRGVAPLADGRVYITGYTSSSDFPTSAGVVQQGREGSGAFVARLKENGEFDIGTLIGRTVSHHPNSIVFNQRATEDRGFVYVAGAAQQLNGAAATTDATGGSFQRNFAGGVLDGFVAKLDAELSRYEYLTYLGGSNQDVIFDLDVNDGFAFVTGTTASTNFPTTEEAAQARHSQAGNANADCARADANRQCFDAFVTRLNRAGSGLSYSTFMGSDREEYARGIAVAANKQATITGAARAVGGGQTDIFVTRFESGGANILWDARLHASGTDHGEEVVVDQFGRAHFTGTVSVDGLATGSNLETFHGGQSDVFYGRVNGNGEIEYFTYLGGTGEDRGFAIAAAGATQENFCAAVAGSTTSADIRTVNPLPGGGDLAGRADLFIYGLCDVRIPPVEFSFTKTASANYVTAGDGLTYTLTVRNGGDVRVPVVVRDEVPAAMTVTGVTGLGCALAGNTVTCSFGAGPGATTIAIDVVADQCPATVDNRATMQVGNHVFESVATTRVSCAFVPPPCPNNRLDPGEQCDDGNFFGGDGCRPDCTREVCTDGILDWPREECDDGNQNDNDKCNNQCHKQIPRGETCASTGPPCASGLVCGEECGIAYCVGGIYIFGFCILGDDVMLCDAEPSCMPEDKATIKIR